MISGSWKGYHIATRTLVQSSRFFEPAKKSPASFLSPKELIEKRKTEESKSQSFAQKLLNKEFEFEPKIVQPNEINESTKRPVPLNVELLKYKPLKLRPTYGQRVAEINFSGYDDTEVLRMAEFSSRAAFYLGIPAGDVQKVKTEKKLYTVIRSPFAQAKSKENFFRTTYKRKLTVYDANPEVIDLWLSYINNYAPESVKRQAQVFTYESLDYAEKMSKLTAADMELPQGYSDNLEDPIGQKVKELLGTDAFKESMKEGK